MQAGVMITNTSRMAGCRAAIIHCVRVPNGMVMQELSIKRTHLGARMETEDGGLATEFRADTLQALDRALALQIRATMKALASPDKIFEHVERLQVTTTRLIEGDPVAAVQVLQKRAGFGDEDRGGILRHLIQGGDLSQWGLCNAVTRYSQDVDDYDLATGMEILGGQIIEMPQSDWKAIATAAA